MDLSAELAAAGVTAECNLRDSGTLAAIGGVLLTAVERRFGKRTIHLGDTSRISGGAKYGEATLRDTGCSELRSAHHAFHLDLFWPGVREIYEAESEEEAVRRTIQEYSLVWGDDLQRLGVSEAEAIPACLGRSGAMVQVWVALTPGAITQQPLALMDRRYLSLSTESTATLPIHFTGLNSTISLLKASAAADSVAGVRMLWRPSMRFGEAFVFLTTATPHSAVWVDGEPDVSRRSAEMRMLLIDDDAAA